MLKKILIFSFIIFSIFFWQTFFSNSFASNVPVEQVFDDVDSDYEYYEELQYMFDNWVILPDQDWNFNPRWLLTRDEFVSIVMEVSCEDCVSPNVSYEILQNYSDEPSMFFDISKENKNYYCVEKANDEGFVKWYDAWTACENWDSRDWETPFCPENNIILEEAIAVILRASGILTNNEADIIRARINSWENFEDLSEDVWPTNNDWSVYSFYPDFQKALSYTVLDYDIYWEQKTTRLLEQRDLLRPKQAITKEQFLRIAYAALKWNSCNKTTDDNLWLQMKIFDKSCSESNSDSCDISSLDSTDDIYDFLWEVWVSQNDSISTDEQYIWRFYNYTTWEETRRYWEYIDNYNFLDDGNYRVFLRVITDNWTTWEVYNDINIWNSTNLDIWDVQDTKISINASRLSWEWPLIVDFESIVSDREDIDSYYWDFWDWNFWYWRDISNTFTNPWFYTVELTTTDSWNNTNTATVVIRVGDSDYDNFCTINDINNNLYWCQSWDEWDYSLEKDNYFSENSDNNSNNNDWNNSWDSDNNNWNNNSNQDTDGDWIPDITDLCPNTFWDEQNNWCPILDNFCSDNSDCDDWYFCTSWVCKPEQFELNCEYSGWDLIYWNTVCNSCPCDNTVDFSSTLRKCDIVFPAITSPDQSTIYSKWNNFRINE